MDKMVILMFILFLGYCLFIFPKDKEIARYNNLKSMYACEDCQKNDEYYLNK